MTAVNLAVTLPALEMDVFPQVLVVLLGSIDFPVVWKLILKRPLRAFHYTFLPIFVVGFFVLATQVAMERFHPLGLLVRWYQHLTGEETNSIALAGFLRVGEIWMACFLSFTLACAMGLLAAWLERRRGWDIAAFFRGSLIGVRDCKSTGRDRRRGMGMAGRMARTCDRPVGPPGNLSNRRRFVRVIEAEVGHGWPRVNGV